VIAEFLADIDTNVQAELKTPVEIVDCAEFPKISELYLITRRWKRVRDVVVVSADMDGSTRLNFDKYAPTSASLFEAATGNMVKIVEAFNPDFVDIQGDGLFAIYHGDKRYERAFCAAETLRTFSEKVLMPRIEELMAERFPRTGLKVGMAAGILVVKKVGVRGKAQEPIWAGKPVAWAVKAAEAAEVNTVMVTKAVYNRLGENDYIAWSCGCSTGVPTKLWSQATVDALPDDEGVECHILRSAWCETCGDMFCQAILEGEKRRSDLPSVAA